MKQAISIEEVRQLAEQVYPTVINNRRYLHAHPELSFMERETSAYIKSSLDKMGIPWEPVTDTGIVAIVRGELPSTEIIALRADIDALPIVEKTDTPFASRNKGVMHACGHDAHTSSLLGTAFILHSLTSRFGGTVKMIFQPGEEKLPGGASLMIKAGVLEAPVPSSIIGQHVMPSLEAGKIALYPGKFMASMDEITVTIYGKGGHGAMPHRNVDPVLIGAHMLVALQQVVSRFSNPTTPSVLSFGKVVADGSINVIPDEAYLEGTFRTMDERWRSEAHARMKKMAEGIAESMGGRCVFTIVRGYPVLVNEEKLNARVGQFAGEYLGSENVTEAEPWMAAEDFSYYSQAMDACFYLLGVGNKEKGITAFLHSPLFDIDEEALRLSTGLMAWMALRQLGN